MHKIQYPRKCNKCEYISNNSSMYHYHNKTHEEIPSGQLCGMGCNRFAKFRNTNGTYSCVEKSQHCPEHLKIHSARVKQQWIGAADRREKTKQSFVSRLHTPEVRAKQKELMHIKYKIFSPEHAKNFRHFARRCRANAQRWAKENGYVLGQKTYHVDHRLSIWTAYHSNLSIDIVNHPINLQVITYIANVQKHNKDDFSIEELFDLIWKYDMEININLLIEQMA